MLMPLGVERAVEIANHNGWRENGELVVWDCLNTPAGTKLVVYPAATKVGGYCATMRDRVGNAVVVASYPTETEAAKVALDHYLSIVNLGI